MHTETVKDPFSSMLNLFHTPTSYIRSVAVHKTPYEAPVIVEEKSPVTTQESTSLHTEETSSQFQKALAASLHQKN
jgi:hypothetical protein